MEGPHSVQPSINTSNLYLDLDLVKIWIAREARSPYVSTSKEVIEIMKKSPQIFRGSFSAVSTATIARKDAFCSIFRDLQDLHSFALR